MSKEDRKQNVWEALKPKVDALITRRINVFHDAMVDRGQIVAPPKPPDATEESVECVNRCIEAYEA